MQRNVRNRNAVQRTLLPKAPAPSPSQYMTVAMVAGNAVPVQADPTTSATAVVQSAGLPPQLDITPGQSEQDIAPGASQIQPQVVVKQLDVGQSTLRQTQHIIATQLDVGQPVTQKPARERTQVERVVLDSKSLIASRAGGRGSVVRRIIPTPVSVTVPGRTGLGLRWKLLGLVNELNVVIYIIDETLDRLR